MLLVDLVAQHFSVVENKRTDAVTMKQKNAEWDWGDYTPKLLQTPKSAPLRAVSKREEDVGPSPTQSKSC
ncbi:unnamed protein product [Parnassius apollo]|uniref:(apollo) hypothetical protein n=1 Tax=Parnassius apollo TaxID=110799 RepID=A0A8S3WIY3_PARAO|nr:unnamed protein product [Parnassius apollo]